MNEKAFFIYAFNKNKRSNISSEELKALKKLAKVYLNLTEEELHKAVQEKKLIKVG